MNPTCRMHAPVTLLALAFTVVAAACSRGADRAGAAADSATAATARSDSASAAGGMKGDTMAGMAGMSGMGGMMGGMTPEMHAHMQMMRGASADSMKAMLPMHRQMVANMLAQMNGEMRQMNMAADPAWTATVDSLRQDLTRMPELSGAELSAMMPAHVGRVTRLAAMHQAMMQKMPK
jgi:hypothetical protein